MLAERDGLRQLPPDREFDGLPGALSTALATFRAAAAQRRRRIPACRHHQRPAEPVPGLRHLRSQRCAVRKRNSWPRAGGGRTAPALLPILEHSPKLLVSISRAGTRPATTSTSARQPPGHPPLCTDNGVLNCSPYTGGFGVNADGRLPPRFRRGYLQEALDVARQIRRSTDWIVQKRSLRDDVFAIAAARDGNST